MAALVHDPRRTARLAGRAVLTVQSDARLAELATDGHERAFDVLVQRYRRPLIRYCGRILPESRAEDAVQQTFMNAHAALLRGDAPTDFRPWLYRVAQNAALNMLRQNGWNYDQIPADLDGVRRPDQIVEQRIELQNTVDAIGELPDRQRTALVMRELEGRSYTEIAVALGAGDGAVRQLLNRARAAVRSAATMMTPPPLVARIASSYQGGDGSRISRAAEIVGGLGAGGVAKVGATALVAGTLVVGAVKAPILDHHGASHPKAHSASAATPVQPAAPAVVPATSDRPIATPGLTHGQHGRALGHARHGGVTGEGHHRSAVGRDETGAVRHEVSGGGDRSGTRERSDSGSPTRTEDHTVSGGTDGSGTSGSGDSTSGTTDGSGSGDSTSGTSGSGDSTTTTTSGDGGSTTTTSGDGGSTSTTSGSGTDGSGTSGSGTSGTSGTSGSDSPTSGTDSGTSGTTTTTETTTTSTTDVPH